MAKAWIITTVDGEKRRFDENEWTFIKPYTFQRKENTDKISYEPTGVISIEEVNEE